MENTMLPIPLLKLANFHLDSKDGIKELAVLSYPIDKSDGTSSTVSYVNSLAILYADGLLVLTGANMYGECGTGDRNECVYPNESIRSIKHVWRADRAFVVETFDNEIKYIGCTAGLIGSTAAGGNDVCVTQWTALPSQITTTLGLDKHPERLLEVCGGMNNTCWVIGAPEGEGIWDIYGSGNNTYGSLHVDKNQHANPVKIAETSQDPATGQWKNPALNLEVHDNSVIYGGPDGYWIAGYDFLRNNSQLNLVYPPEHGTWAALTESSETYKWFMCGPNGAVVATERIHTDGSGLPVYVFRGQNSWGDKTWSELNVTYTHEVVIARGHATNGIFFNNGSKQYRGFSRNLCNDIGAQSVNNSPGADFIHYQALATAAYVEQRTPVSWAENVYFQGINREGFLGTLTVVNGKLWWSGVPRGNYPGSNNLFGGQLNSQGFTQVDPNWIKNVPVSDFEVEEVVKVNGWGSERPVSNIYVGDAVQLKVKALPKGATWFVDKVEITNAAQTVVSDPLYTATINHNVFGVWDSIITQQNKNVDRRGLYHVKITYHDKNGTHTHLTRNINWNTIVPVIPSDSTWYTQGLNRSLSFGSTTYLGLDSAQPATENADAFKIRLHRKDVASVTYDVTQEIYDERREMYNYLVANQALWEYNPNGAGGKMYQANEQNGTSLNVHEHADPWPTPEKPYAGARTLKVVSYDAGFFGLRWESTIEYYDGTHQNIGLTLGGDSASTSRKIAYIPHGVNITVDLVKNSYGDIQALVTPAEATTNVAFSFAAFKEDPRVVGAHDADWYITYTPQATEHEFLLGMKRDMQRKLGMFETCYVCIKDTRVKDTDPEAKWFTIDANTECSDRYIYRYIACLGGTNLNLFWEENADRYSSYDYLRDVCATSWLNSNGWAPGECQIVPCVFTDNQTFLLKQANEVQAEKNGYDGTKWFFNCYAQYYWGPGELYSDAGCYQVDKEIGSWTHMNQTCNFIPQNVTSAASPVLDAFISIEKVHDPRGDLATTAMAMSMALAFQQVKLVVSCDMIGKNVPTEGGIFTPYVIDCYYNINGEGYREERKITSADTSKCRHIALGAGWWLYEFDFSTVADWATDSGNTLNGIRFNFGQNMLPEAISGGFGNPVVHVKQVMLEKTDQSEVYGKQLQLIKNWYEAETTRIPKTGGVVLDAGTEDMLVKAVWPNLDGTSLENAARSVNWFNFHRAMWSVNIFLWKLFHDQTKGFGSDLRVAPICWTSLMRCYNNQWEIGGREWQNMRMSIYSQFAVEPVNYYNSGTSRILFQEGSEAYKVEGYNGSMIEWGLRVATREVLAREIRDAVGPDLVQRQVPRWMTLPCWNKTAANTYANTNEDGDLFLYFDDMSQYTNWTPGNIHLQVWDSAGSLVYTTTNAANDNCCVLPKAKLEECFGVAHPDPVTLSMMVYDQTSGALGPRVSHTYSNIEYAKPLQYMNVRTGCTLSPDSNKKWWGMPNTSWITDEYILIYPKKALDNATIDATSTYNNLAKFVVRKDLAYTYPTPGDGTIPDADATLGAWCVPVEVHWTNETERAYAGMEVTASVKASDEAGTFKGSMVGPYTKGFLAISPRVTAKTGSVSIYGFSNSDSWALMDNNHTWAAGSNATYEFLLKGFYTSLYAYQERGTYPYSQSGTQKGFYVTDNFLPGGAASLDFEVTSSDPTVFVATKLADRKFTISAVKNGSAVITITATVSYGEGSHTFSKLYNWKCGSGTVITGLSDLPNPFNGIGIKGGGGVMRKPTLQPDGAVAASESWSTDNPDAVKITTGTGQVTFVGVGTAVITYSCTDIDGTVFTKTTTITVKEIHPQYRAWVGNPTDGAYPQPYGTSLMESFSSSPCTYQTLVQYPMRVFGGMYIPELKGVPAGQLTIYTGDPARLANFGYSSPTVALSESGWCGYELDWDRMENGKTYIEFAVAVQGISQNACRAGFNIREA